MASAAWMAVEMLATWWVELGGQGNVQSSLRGSAQLEPTPGMFMSRAIKSDVHVVHVIASQRKSPDPRAHILSVD